MKNVLITGGPSNEYIDEVMKITNMSSGRIATELAEWFIGAGYNVTLILTKTIKYDLNSPKLKLVRFETTAELEKAIENASKSGHYDVVIHSAAVADYKPEFSFRMEDMAQEISEFILDNIRVLNEQFTSQEIYNEIFRILTDPECKVNDSSKISSNEAHLTVKLGLTTKIIYNLRKWFPDALICGFKLLENVSQKELVDAAMRIIDKSGVNLVFANDLAKLRQGNPERLVVSHKGFNDVKVKGAEGIFNLIHILN